MLTLNKCRSGSKSKVTTSGKFNIPQDLKGIMAANTQKDGADPLRITISKFDKKHWHEPSPEDDNLAPGTPISHQVRPVERMLSRCCRLV